MQRNADWIRRGLGEYAAMSEAQITAGLGQLSDQLNQLRQQMGQNGAKQADDKSAQQALSDVEKLRQQLQAYGQSPNGQRGGQQAGQRGQQGGQPQQGQQQGQNGQPGQNGKQQGGQQQGQGGQPQQGQQQGGQSGGQQGGQNGQANSGGQQGGGGQQGQPSGQGGQQLGGRSGGDPQGSYANPGGGGGGANNSTSFGDYVPNNGNSRDAIINSYRGALQSLQQLQQQYKNDPSAQRDINNLIHDFRNFDPTMLNNDPLLNQRIAAALANVEQVELELRRKVADTAGGDGTIRSPGSEQIPPGYSGPVAEYYRRLSSAGKKQQPQPDKPQK